MSDTSDQRGQRRKDAWPLTCHNNNLRFVATQLQCGRCRLATPPGVSGAFDYLLKAHLSAMREYRELLGDIPHRIPVPARSNSYVIMEETTETLSLPVPA